MKIYLHHLSHEGVYLEDIKKLLQFNKKKKNQFKTGKDMNRHFFKEHIQMANKHVKRCSTPLAIREMQIKTTMRYHFTPT